MLLSFLLSAFPLPTAAAAGDIIEAQVGKSPEESIDKNRDCWEIRIRIHQEETWGDVTSKMQTAYEAIRGNTSEWKGYLLQHVSFPEQNIRLSIDDWAPPRSSLHLVFSEEGITVARVTFTSEGYEPPRWFLDEPPLSLRREDFSLVQQVIQDIFYTNSPATYDAVFIYIDDNRPISFYWQYVREVALSAPVGKTIPLRTPLMYHRRTTQQQSTPRDISPLPVIPVDIPLSIDP